MASNNRKHNPKKQSRIHKEIKRLARDRGIHNEIAVLKALESLRDDYNTPIKVTFMRKGSLGDSRGVDIKINGMRVNGKDKFNAEFGIDVKSSQRGVDEYFAKQKELQLEGYKNPYPRYPFLFHYQTQSVLLVELLLFILDKSETHNEYKIQIDSINKSEGQNFHHQLRSFISEIFDL